MQKRTLKSHTNRFTKLSLVEYSYKSAKMCGVVIYSRKTGRKTGESFGGGGQIDYRIIAAYMTAHKNATPPAIQGSARTWMIEQVAAEDEQRAKDSAAFDWTESEQAAG